MCVRRYVADLDPDLAWCIEQGAPCWFNYMFSFFSIVDLVAIIPWYFEIAGLIPPQMGDYLRTMFFFECCCYENKIKRLGPVPSP